ncbi:MAG TPA: DUF2786 domain-containing protein [Nitrospirota bacterium]
MSILDRIQKLLALAKSSEIEEARSASHRAALLILEHGVVLRLPGEESSFPRSFEDAFASVWEAIKSDPEAEVIRRAAEEAKVARNRARGASIEDLEDHVREAQRRTGVYSDVFRTPSGRQSAPTKPVRWKAILARKKGLCGICGVTFDRGSKIFWAPRGWGARHDKCHQHQEDSSERR